MYVSKKSQLICSFGVITFDFIPLTPPWNCVVTGSSVSFSKYTGPGRCRVAQLEKLWTKSSAAFVVIKTPRPKYVKPNYFFRALTRAKWFNQKQGRDFVVPAGSQHTPADSEKKTKKDLLVSENQACLSKILGAHSEWFLQCYSKSSIWVDIATSANQDVMHVQTHSCIILFFHRFVRVFVAISSC